jgi:geranylgeranyl reductase family protein
LSGAPRAPEALTSTPGVERFDVIIVGAGPAGSTTAYRLARDGVSVLLVDKACFPRDKPCGGAVTVRAMRELPFDIQPVVEHEVNRMEFSFRGHRAFRRGGRALLAQMTQRRNLDRFLVEQAAGAGAVFRDDVKISHITERGASVDGSWVDAELLIGADGVNGPSARALGLGGNNVYAVALEGNLLHGAVDPERWRGTIMLELGSIAGGYRWIFPKGDHVNIGVGGWESEGPGLREHFKAFCRQCGFDSAKVESMRGYRLAARRPGSAFADTRTLLVGDAAGLIDPLWGDGISAAFMSSRLAADVALDFLAGKISSLKRYEHNVIAELGPMAGFAWDAKLALDRMPRTIAAAVVSPLGWRVVEKMMRGEIQDPGAERGLPGVVIRGLQASGRRAGWPGAEYRVEASVACGPES